MNKILLIGSSGQVGQALQQTLQPLGNVISLGRKELDLSQPETIPQVIAKIQPSYIINAAAYTAVDKAESESELAHTINSTAPTIIAQMAQTLGATFLHISTDYIFDGKNHTPYTETDTPNPFSVYGESKLLGEKGIQENCKQYLILRTAWVYGNRGHGNFVKTMLRLGAEREELRVVADQIGTPTHSQEIAKVIPQLLKIQAKSGIYHFTNSGVASWYDFAVAIFEEAKQLGYPLQIKRVIPITTLEYPTPAKRPAYSVLSNTKINQTLGAYSPHWRESLREMINAWINR